MGDYFSGNPYLTDPRFQLPEDQQNANKVGSLGTLLLGLGTGIAGNSGSGQPWFNGIAPGLNMGVNAVNQQQAQLAHMQEAAAKYQQMEDYRKAQEEDLKGKAAERDFGMNIDKYILDRMKGGGGPPGLGSFNPNAGPNMGPGSAPASGPPVDLQKSGAPIVNYLQSQHGLSPQAAAGVAGNLYQESGFNPNAVGDSGTAGGMAQWRGERQAGLLKFAQAQGKPPNDPQTQLDYMMAEMKGGDMGAQRAYAELQRARTPEEAAAAMMHFERPQGYTPGNPQGGHGYAQRVQYANTLMPQGGPQPGAAPPGAPPQMVAQAGTYRTPSGATVDPSIPPPAFMGPQGGDAPQTQPGVMPQPPAQFNGPPGASAGIDPTTEAMLMSKRFGRMGEARLTNQNQQFTQELERQRFLYQQKQDAEKQALESANKDVTIDPVTGQPITNQPLIGAKKEISAVQGTDPAGHGLKLLMDQSVKTHGEYQAAAQGARTAQPNLERLNTLISGLDTGKTKEITTDTKAWLKDLGVNLDAFGVLDDTGRAQAAKALGSQLALTLRNPANGGGLPGSMSNYEDKLLQSMSPSLVQTPEGNRILLDALRKQNQRSVELGRVANNWMREKGGKNLLNDPAGLHAVIDKYVEEHPLFTAEDAKKITAPAPSMAPAAPAEDLYKRYNLKPAK